MKIIVGLGNPGDKYAFTRHNTGFLTLDLYAEEHGFNIKKAKGKALYGETNINGEKVIFLKPQTFMNLSGIAVREIMDFYKVSIDDILVIYDDISLPLGKLRVRAKGSAGGHNGIKNIICQLGSDTFARVKIGISTNDRDLADYVLSNFSKSELATLRKVSLMCGEIIDLFVKEGVNPCMNLYNGKEIIE